MYHYRLNFIKYHLTPSLPYTALSLTPCIIYSLLTTVNFVHIVQPSPTLLPVCAIVFPKYTILLSYPHVTVLYIPCLPQCGIYPSFNSVWMYNPLLSQCTIFHKVAYYYPLQPPPPTMYTLAMCSHVPTSCTILYHVPTFLPNIICNPLSSPVSPFANLLCT